MNPPDRKRLAHRLVVPLSLVALALLAGGCVVPNPGPVNKVPANYVSGVNVTVANVQ